MYELFVILLTCSFFSDEEMHYFIYILDNGMLQVALIGDYVLFKFCCVMILIIKRRVRKQSIARMNLMSAYCINYTKAEEVTLAIATSHYIWTCLAGVSHVLHSRQGLRLLCYRITDREWLHFMKRMCFRQRPESRGNYFVSRR